MTILLSIITVVIFYWWNKKSLWCNIIRMPKGGQFGGSVHPLLDYETLSSRQSPTSWDYSCWSALNSSLDLALPSEMGLHLSMKVLNCSIPSSSLHLCLSICGCPLAFLSHSVFHWSFYYITVDLKSLPTQCADQKPWQCKTSGQHATSLCWVIPLLVPYMLCYQGETQLSSSPLPSPRPLWPLGSFPGK